MKHYANWCEPCIMAAHHEDPNTVTMLSGYCLVASCGKCGRETDLALVGWVCCQEDCPLCKTKDSSEPFGLDMAGELDPL